MKEKRKYFKIPQNWIDEQLCLQAGILQKPVDTSKIRYIAGVDVSYEKSDEKEYGYCSIVIINYETLECVEKVEYIQEVDIPYIPGYFTFRELPLVREATKKITIEPDIYMFDGNGIWHPLKMGLATHASFYLKKPCIGVAKKFFHFDGISELIVPKNTFGDYTKIYNGKKELIGIALRSKLDTKPIFVSVGNYMTLDNAREIVMHCLNDESHIPVPTRLADIESGKMRREN